MLLRLYLYGVKSKNVEISRPTASRLIKLIQLFLVVMQVVQFDQGGVISGTGHNSITWSRDGKEMYCVYHGRTTRTGHERLVFIDRMFIDDDGSLIVEGPTSN